MESYTRFLAQLNYYETTGLKQADQILRITQFAYSKGEIAYVEYSQNLSQALSVKFSYLEALSQFNQAVINLDFLTGAN